MADQQLAVEIADLTKRFGSFKALDRLDLSVAPGQVTGFLGPNGAGKSTAIKVLLGLLRADGGAARLFGGDAWKDAVALHQRIAYVPGDVSLWPNLSGGECIDYLTRLKKGGDRARRRRRKAELLEEFRLDPTKKARTYSKGNRQKVALVAALIDPCDLYILDEPTSGLDPLMESVFTEHVRAAKAEGSSVLLSSHILSEVEKVCDEVTIIRAGTAVESGTLEELRHLTRSSVVAIVRGDTSRLGGLTGVNDLVITPNKSGTRVAFDVDNEHVGAVLTSLTSLELHGITVTPPSLEELFLRHYGDVIGEESGEAHR